jgi:hypothetical protein
VHIIYSIFRHARDIARVTCCQPWSDFRDFITTCANTPRQPDKIDTSAISLVADPLDATRSNVAILGLGSWTAFDIDNNEAASSTPFRAIDGRLKGKALFRAQTQSHGVLTGLITSLLPRMSRLSPCQWLCLMDVTWSERSAFCSTSIRSRTL